VGERHTPPVDADERHVLQVLASLDDLVCDPGERPLDPLCVEEDLPGRHARLAQGTGGFGLAGAADVIRNSFPASLDRA
jgi:hypothetical protein